MTLSNDSLASSALPASPIRRVFIVVLDSAGVGFMPDAGEYGEQGGDLGANTLGHIGDAVGLTVPVMESLGLGRIIPIPAALADYRQHGTNAMGASTSGLFRRSLTALRTPDRIRARIAFSYRNAAQFQQAYGDLLPKEAQKVLADFAQIPQLRKMARLRALRKGGFRMQSKAARAGMMLFG